MAAHGRGHVSYCKWLRIRAKPMLLQTMDVQQVAAIGAGRARTGMCSSWRQSEQDGLEQHPAGLAAVADEDVGGAAGVDLVVVDRVGPFVGMDVACSNAGSSMHQR